LDVKAKNTEPQQAEGNKTNVARGPTKKVIRRRKRKTKVKDQRIELIWPLASPRPKLNLRLF